MLGRVGVLFVRSDTGLNESLLRVELELAQEDYRKIEARVKEVCTLFSFPQRKEEVDLLSSPHDLSCASTVSA